jgi:hypothetical protein
MANAAQSYACAEDRDIGRSPWSEALASGQTTFGELSTNHARGFPEQAHLGRQQAGHGFAAQGISGQDLHHRPEPMQMMGYNKNCKESLIRI